MALGEPDASTGGGVHAGPTDNHLELSFWFRTVGTTNDGSQAAIGIADTFAKRMVLCRLRTLNGGVSLTEVFSNTIITTGVTFGTWHEVRASVDFVPGPSNDIVRWYLDGALVKTLTTWENFYTTPTAVDGVSFSMDVLARRPRQPCSRRVSGPTSRVNRGGRHRPVGQFSLADLRVI